MKIKCIYKFGGLKILDKFIINGGKRLYGSVSINGAKNAVAAILPATILAQGPCVIENVPNISDVINILSILSEMGADVKLLNKSSIQIDTTRITKPLVPYHLAKQMRASYYFLGVLLAKFNRAEVSYPGGCNFGVRPIDQHLKGFRSLGARDSVDQGGMINIQAEELTGSRIYLDMASVGATINIMLAAVKANGLTVIENAAKEPHIVDLANFLNSIGADIMGAGTDVIKIHGVQNFTKTTYSVIPDQIECGTYMIMAAATKGDVLVKNIIPKHMEAITSKLQKMGVEIQEFDDAIRVSVPGELVKNSVKTDTYPGFPTDMQPQITALLTLAEGTSIVTENIWDNRFQYVDELRRMGANISVDGKVAVIEGAKNGLTGAPVSATDLRGGAAMVIAGLAANGVTEIENIKYIERGYEDIVNKLRGLGADITRKYVAENELKQAL